MLQSIIRRLTSLVPALGAGALAIRGFAGRQYLAGAILVVIAAICLAIAAYQFWPGVLVWDRDKGLSAPRLVQGRELRLDQLPGLVAAMSHATAPVRYAGMVFNTPDRPADDDAVNLNLSFENGTVGFDWVLLASRNIEDQARFTSFARAHGFEPRVRSMNGVSYLRVEGGDVVKFTARVVTEMYGQPSDQPLGLVHEGFAWPGD